jgi:molybdopterin converting factor small subunit
MTVTVQFHGLHRMTTRTNEIRMPISENTRVRDVITYISDRYPDLELKDGRVLIVVNNELTPIDRTLSPNDKISFLPPLGGG